MRDVFVQLCSSFVSNGKHDVKAIHEAFPTTCLCKTSNVALKNIISKHLVTLADARSMIPALVAVAPLFSERHQIQWLWHYGNIIKQKSPELAEFSRLNLLLPDEQFNRERENAKKRVIAYHQDVIHFSATNILRLIERGFSSVATCEEKLIACSLMSGARKIEILRLATFEPSNTPGFMYQIGKAKSGTVGESFVIHKPIIGASFNEFIKLLNSIREPIEGNTESNDALVKKFDVRSTSRRDLAEFGTRPVGTHAYRKLYAAYCCAECKPDTMTDELFRSTILGHDVLNLTTQLAYGGFRITE